MDYDAKKEVINNLIEAMRSHVMKRSQRDKETHENDEKAKSMLAVVLNANEDLDDEEEEDEDGRRGW